MAQKFISPGVFTNEVDLSFLAQGVAGIGAAIVGRTPKGPAMVPMFVTGLDSFAKIFGDPNPSYVMTYGAKLYLKNSSALAVVRVLGHSDGTSTTNGYVIDSGINGITDNASGSVLAVVHHTGSEAAFTVTGVPGSADDFIVSLTGSAGVIFAATASFVTTAANYIEKVLNTDPTKYSTYGHYLYQNFSYRAPATSASWGNTAINGSTVSFERNFSSGSTAWVMSQPIGGQEFNLFRFHTLGHGKATTNDVKVMISNVKPSAAPSATPYGTFDVVVRQFSDTDQRVVSLETFTGCNLDPDSINYLARVVGDHVEEFDTTQRKFVGEGDHENKSALVRVEMNTAANAPADALPWGHRGYSKETFQIGSRVIPDMLMVPNQFDKAGNLDSSIAFGISFVSGGIEDRMFAKPNSATTVNDADFTLANLSASYYNGKQIWNYVSGGLSPAAQHQPVFLSSSLYKFCLPFAGGFDGFDLRVADPLYVANTADDTNIGVVSLKRALDTIANPDAVDINLLAIPGIHNIKVTDKARQIVNDRGDAMYVMDVTGSSVAEVVNQLKAREIDDNYTATYYPSLKLKDKTNNGRIVKVPASVGVLGAIAFSDKVGQAWFAPAGLTRGGLGQFDITDVADRLNFQDRNDLYENRINPIASFPKEGIVVFGQKTLQVKASALDRVNVRRLLIFSKKTIASAAKYLLFESNNSSTWQRFINTVNPILDNVKMKQGLERFQVVMDTSTNTQEMIDRNIMVGKIFLQPTKVAEFISLDFVITNAGVSFGE